MKKAVRLVGDDVYLGRIYDDDSYADLLRLYHDDNGIFQIQFLKGSDIAYTFLAECTELINILRDGIIGVTNRNIAHILDKKFQKEINPIQPQYCKRVLQESYEHIKPYLNNMRETKELRMMCRQCPHYHGKDHDYDTCKNKPCFQFYLAYEYLEWSKSYD